METGRQQTVDVGVLKTFSKATFTKHQVHLVCTSFICIITIIIIIIIINIRQVKGSFR